jgi:CBS domain containing-hemolysin-like protein
MALWVLTPLLILLTAFFVAAEFAAVRVRSTQLDALKGKDSRALLALEVHEDLGRHLSSIQVGITICTLAIGATGEDTLVHILQLALGRLPWPKVGFFLGWALGLLLVTLVQVVLAELLPRNLAIRHSTAWALRTATPLLLWSRLMSPFTKFLLALSHGVERLLGLKGGAQDEEEDEHLPSEEELRHMLQRSQEEGRIPSTRAEMIENLFDFSKRTVAEIAVPRALVISFDVRRPLEENLARVRATPHTRIPLVDGDLDHVLGVVHLKELLWAMQAGETVDMRAFARPAFLVPEMKPIQGLLLEFQQRRQHLALVVNEHGGVDGLVTLEDVLEELVGEIQDEFDRETIQLRRTKSGAWLAQGNVTLEQLEDHLKLNVEAGEGTFSLGGYFQERLGRVLRVGDELRLPGWRIRVLGMRGMAPTQFLLKPVPSNHAD